MYHLSRYNIILLLFEIELFKKLFVKLYFEKVWFQNGMPNMHKLGEDHIIKEVETILSMTKNKNDMPYRLFIRHKEYTSTAYDIQIRARR